MEKQNFERNSVEKIRDFLEDYSNNFMALDIILMGGGISAVRKLIKQGYKVLTVEEYLEKQKKEDRDTISMEDQKNTLFIEKTKLLNKLANDINSLGENINEQIIKETMEQITEITTFTS